MMAGDDDIAAEIPQPPPPAPLRRQAAIDEAMRRFDVAHGAEPVAAPPVATPAREPWWGRIGRPQAAALVTAGLVALLGVPAAWLSVSKRSAPVSHTQLASADSAMTAQATPEQATPKAAIDVPSDASAGEAPPAAAPPLALPKPEQPAAVPGALLAKDEARESVARDMPQSVAESAAPIQLARAEPAVPAETVVTMMHAKQAYASRADSADRVAAAPPPAAMVAPPPPPPAPAPMMVASADAGATASGNFTANTARQAKAGQLDDRIVAGRARAESASAGSIMVAAKRRDVPKSGGRGDWNACTIDDPARSLDRCKGQINPGSTGSSGRAAAHVADGLMRAWRGDLDGAIVNFDRAIAVSPRNAVAYLNRGLALQRKGEFSRASADLDRAVRYAPRAARGYYNRSLLLRQRGEADRAEADADRAVALDPGYVAVIK